MKIFLSLLLVCSFLPDFTTSDVISDPTGTWDFTVQAPDMTYSGEIEISGEEGEYKGTISAGGATADLKDLTIEDGEFSFSMFIQGFACDVEGSIEGDKMDGVVSVEGLELVLKATRSE